MSSVATAAAPSESAVFHFFAKLTKYADNVSIFNMKIFRWLATIIMFLIAAEVTMRYVFRSPTPWSADVQLYLSAAQRCIGIGFATMVHSHIIMDVFIGKWKWRSLKILDLFGYFFYYIPLMIALEAMTYNRAVKAWIEGEKLYSVWRPVIWPVLFFMVYAYGLFIMQILAEVTKTVIDLQKGDEKWRKAR